MPLETVEKDFVFRKESIKIKIKRLNWPERNTLREKTYSSVNVGGIARVEYHAFEAQTEAARLCLVDAPFKIEDLTPDEGDCLYALIDEINTLTEKKNTNSGENSIKA